MFNIYIFTFPVDMAKRLNFQQVNTRNAGHTLTNHEDVDCDTPINGDVISFNDTKKIWENKQLSSFPDLDDTFTYTTGLSIVRVNNTVNGLEESGAQILTVPLANHFTITCGTTDLFVSTDCTLDQNLSTTSAPTFTGVSLTAAAANPGGNSTFWNFTGDIPRHGVDNIILGPTASTDNRIVRFDGTATKIQSTGVTIDDSNNVSGVGTLGVSGGITSTYTGAAVRIIDFNVGGSAGNYSYFGTTSNNSFGRMRGSGVFLCSDDNLHMRVGSTGSDYFAIQTGINIPISTTNLFKVSGAGNVYLNADATYFNTLKDEYDMASNSANAICTQQSIKAYVDSFYLSSSQNNTLTDIHASPTAFTLYYTKSGNIVTLTTTDAQAAVTTNTYGRFGTALVTAIRPARAQTTALFVKDNAAVNTSGYINISTDGTVYISPSGLSGFTSGGVNGGLQNASCIYQLT